MTQKNKKLSSKANLSWAGCISNTTTSQIPAVGSKGVDFGTIETPHIGQNIVHLLVQDKNHASSINISIKGKYQKIPG
jgi:hypothetical protein